MKRTHQRDSFSIGVKLMEFSNRRYYPHDKLRGSHIIDDWVGRDYLKGVGGIGQLRFYYFLLGKDETYKGE